MTTTEIKKELYKTKITATLAYAKNGNLNYVCTLESGGDVSFRIPFEDMGDGKFETYMPAQLLNRWIVNNNG